MTDTGPPPPSIPLVDPYGIDLAIDATGDLRVTASGSVGLVSGPYNCAQAVSLRMRTTPGELPLHPEYGSSLPALIGAKLQVGGIVQHANADLQTMLAEDPRFVTAAITTVAKPATTFSPESVALSATAKLVGGESLTLDNVSDPSPSDVSLPQLTDPSIDPTLTFDPLTEQEFFADTPELDSLNDINQVTSIVNDTPNASILGTGG